MTHSGGYQRVTAKENRFKYNGKEEITDLGINWYDYGARMYMADIGRWGVVDPAADLLEMSTPYAYSLNNPINFVDLDGELPIYINGNTSADSERGDASYWDAELLSTIRNSGIANPGGQELFVDGNRGVNYVGKVINASTHGFGGGGFAGSRKRAGEIVAKQEFENILSLLEKDPESGKIIEKIQIYSHSRGGAFAEGYTSALMKLISENADRFEDPSNVIQYSLNLAPHQSNSIDAVEGVETIAISHKRDILSGNDVEGAINVHSKVGTLETAHGNGTFVSEVAATIAAILKSDKDNTDVLTALEKALNDRGIDFSIKQK